ncbi:MAG: hypothetical protein J5879_09320 [Clostridia bacterium]|nr:hypothetical protein [Clostridia bacterium]
MKKLPVFWKIYIFAVTVIALLCCAVLSGAALFLQNYEEKAEAERQTKAREAEISARIESESLAESVFVKRNGEELEGAKILTKRNALLGAMAEAEDAAAIHVSLSLDSTPERVMDALVALLDEKGVEAIGDKLKTNIGPYETQSAACSYINNMIGKYSYEKQSELSYALKKVGLTARVTLAVTGENDDGHKTYAVREVQVDLPLTGCVIETPENAELFVNGIKAKETPELTPVPVSDVIPDTFYVPSTARYEIGGFIRQPELKAYTDGLECVVVRYPSRTVFLTPSNDKYKTELFDRICKLSFAYSDFVAGVFDFSVLKPYLYPGTRLYKDLSTFDNRWYYNYDHIVNENPSVSNVTVLSEQLVYADISYNQALCGEDGKVNHRVKIKLRVYLGCDERPSGTDTSVWRLVAVEL